MLSWHPLASVGTLVFPCVHVPSMTHVQFSLPCWCLDAQRPDKAPAPPPPTEASHSSASGSSDRWVDPPRRLRDSMAATGPRVSRTDPSGVHVPGIVKVAEYVGDLRALGQCCRAAGRLCQREGSRRVWGWLSDSDFEAAEEWARAEERETYYSGAHRTLRSNHTRGARRRPRAPAAQATHR